MQQVLQLLALTRQVLVRTTSKFLPIKKLHLQLAEDSVACMGVGVRVRVGFREWRHT